MKLRLLISMVLLVCWGALTGQKQIDTSTFQYIHLADYQLRFSEKDNTSMLRSATIPRFLHSAFFCRLEENMHKSAPLQFSFRLGDMQYVDKLEGKTYKPDPISNKARKITNHKKR